MSVRLIAAATLALRRKGQRGPVQFPRMREWTTRYYPSFLWYRHLVEIEEAYHRALDGTGPKNIVAFMPPRHGKSFLSSQYLPAYHLSRFPKDWSTVVSYGDLLANGFTRNVRSLAQVDLNPEKATAALWETAQGGGAWSAGIMGAGAGRGTNLGIFDDLVKDAQEALSPVIRLRNEDQLQTVFLPRFMPPRQICINVSTRWAVFDASNYLLRYWKDQDEPVYVIHMPALAIPREEVLDIYKEYPNVTVAPDPRDVGEALCPERFTQEQLEKIRDGMSPFWWSAVYQQNPFIREGGMFPSALATVLRRLPDSFSPAIGVRGWDKAASRGGQGARSAGVRVDIGYDGHIFIRNVVYDRWSTRQRDAEMLACAQRDGLDILVATEQEPGSGGKESAEATTRMLLGWTVINRPSIGDKASRAEPLSSQWLAGNVTLVGDPDRDPWINDFLAEAKHFPGGLTRDMVDSASLAFNIAAERFAGTAPAMPVGGEVHSAFPL